MMILNSVYCLRLPGALVT